MLKVSTLEELTNDVATMMSNHSDIKIDKNSPRDYKVRDFSFTGLTQFGQKMNFPAPFIRTLNNSDSTLTESVLKNRVDTYFDSHDSATFTLRDFSGQHCGVVSDRYAVFDDDEVVDILNNTKFLENSAEMWCDSTPERFHARFISPNKLNIEGDNSPLSMAIFIDNSMVGLSTFKVRFGIYRWACTNGMIAGLKEFTLIKKRHIGNQNFYLDFQKALADAPHYETILLDMVKDMSVSKSRIYEMTDEDAVRYLKDKLTCGKKTATKVFEAYNAYGGTTKWDLVNAITDVAHEYATDTRLLMEERAMRVA